MIIPEEVLNKLRELEVKDVARRLGIEVIKNKCHCFMHNDASPSMSFNPHKPSTWYCFACAKGGNSISLVMEHQGLKTPSNKKC